MPSRRQEKMARVIREEVSEIIRDHLQDPRVTGLVSVTAVDVAPDLKSAEVYLSILGNDETSERLAFTAIEHAGRHIQHELGPRMTTKFCPHLRFHRDEKLRSTMETFRLIEEARAEQACSESDEYESDEYRQDQE